MHFLTGFHKIADFGLNTGGREYKLEDRPEPYAAGAAQMAPTGIPVYNPKGIDQNSQQALNKKDKNIRAASVMIAMSKMSSILKFGYGLEGSYALGADGAGAGMDTAEAVSEQLKYTTSHNMKPEYMGYDKNSKAQYMKYLNAAKKGVKK